MKSVKDIKKNPLKIDLNGMELHARQFNSPNCDQRPRGMPVELIVVHSISLPPGHFGGMGIVDLFLNRLNPGEHPYYQNIVDLKVSAHFLIRRDGELLQFVGCNQRAWHAGASCWEGRNNCNDFSIGIELEGAEGIEFCQSQYMVLAELGKALMARFPIKDFVGHEEIAVPAGRKTDPGALFSWECFNKLMKD